MNADDLDDRISTIKKELSSPALKESISTEEKLRQRVKTLESDLRRRQTSFVRRERSLRSQINELESNISKLQNSSIHDKVSSESMEDLRNLHEDIMEKIKKSSEKNADKLAKQEKDLSRSFSLRLSTVQDKLDKERNRSLGDEVHEWMRKYEELEASVKWLRSLSDKMEEKNTHLVNHNSTLRAQFVSQEEDRALLVKQLVLAKKDNSRFRQEFLEMKSKLDKEKQYSSSLEQQQQIRQHTQLNKRTKEEPFSEFSHTEDSGKHINYKEMFYKQKQILETARRNLRKVRNKLNTEVNQRSELEIFLHLCLNDVRTEISRRKGISKLAVELSQFDRAARERTLELLLSQEKVVSLLYKKTFLQDNQSDDDRFSEKCPTGDSLDEIITRKI